ncbi:MAG: DUF1501 domain-containing protein, partial [Flavobacteriales bacterium]|nr:DUF1501 domain-containing protein [Flavobacteriales bacterium]
MDKKKTISRRKFIGTTSCAAVGYTTLFSSLLNLKAFEAAALDNSMLMPTDGYRALVCLMLGGGNDSYNMLIPMGAPYADYQVTRSNLAIPSGDLLPIDPLNTPGSSFGIHPSMPEVKALFDAGKIGFVANVGSMVQPTTREQFQSGT